MGIYDPLRDYLRAQTTYELELRFSEISQILGRALPASAEQPQWWNNRKDLRRSQRDAWRDAGYEACLIKSASRVRFTRLT